LKKSLLDRGLPLPGAVTPVPPVAGNTDNDLKLPRHADIDRMMAAVEKLGGAWSKCSPICRKTS